MSKFIELIKNINATSEQTQLLAAVTVESLEYSETENLLRVALNAPETVNEELLKQIAAATGRFLGIDDVEVYQEVKAAVSFHAFCAQPVEMLAELGVDLPPVVWRALNSSVMDISRDAVKITVDNETIERMLCENDFERKVLEALRKCPDGPAPGKFEINITISESGECAEAIEEDLKNAEFDSAGASTALSEISCSEGGSAASEPQIMGKKFDNDPVRIVEVLRNVAFEGNCTCAVAGRLTALEIRKLQRGSSILTFNVVDATEAIKCKIFLRPKDQPEWPARLRNGIEVCVFGTAKPDSFERNMPVLEIKSIRLLPPKPARDDKASSKRVELHCHTKMSALDAVMTASQIVSTAARWGHNAVAITDHGVVQSFPEAAAAAKKYNKAAKERGSDHRIKVIYGLEGYLIPDALENDAKAPLNHIIILAKNKTGLKNLYKLVSDSHIKRYKKRPRIAREDLVKYREGLIIGSACEAGELYQAVVHGENTEVLKSIAAFYDYLEIQPLSNNAFMIRKGIVKDYAELQNINKKIIEIGRQTGKPVIATTDAHFLDPDDEIFRSIILAVKGMEDGSHPLPLFFRTTEEMLAEFSYLGPELAEEVVVTNPGLVAGSIEELQPIPSELFPPKISGSEELIENLAKRNARAIYGDVLPDVVRERLDFELKSIIGHNYAVLYNIAHKLVKKSNEDGYLVGSRGSVGSSFVATMTGITEVNPLPPHWICDECHNSEFVLDGTYANGFDLPDKTCSCGALMRKDGHNIPFAVFMGFEGDKIPDIDLNFSGEYQARIHKYTEELLGKENVFRAGTISTVAEKNAIGFVRKYFEEKGVTASDAYVTSFSEGCVGVKRTTGQHPGGLMVVPYDMDICDITPVQYPAEAKDTDIITTHFDYHSIHDALVKLDNLGHDVPTIIKDLKELSGIDPIEIPFDDAPTLSLFNSTDAVGLLPDQLLGSTVATFGIPEFGTKFVREMLKDIQPGKFSELVRISGFSHGTDVWLGNAKDLIGNKTARVGEVISARDDIMIYLIEMGLEKKHAFTVMESVRKGKGLKEHDVEEMKKNKVPGWYIESCQKIKYLFPKAHAVAYVMMAFRIAWFKIHSPLAFYAASFSVKAEEFDAEMICNGLERLKREYELIERKGKEASGKEEALMPVMELAMEMYQRGFEFHKVDLNKSHNGKFIITEGKILPPLCALAGLGGNAALNILRARDERPFTSIEDMQIRARLNKTVIEVLRTHGCLDGMDETDQMTLF